MDHSVCVHWWKEKEKELTSLTFGQLESGQIVRDRKLCNLKSCLSGTYRKPRFIFLLLTLLYARKMCTSASVVLLVPLSDALCACFLDPNGLPSWKLTADRWGSWSIQCYLVIISFTPSCRMFKMFLKWAVKWLRISATEHHCQLCKIFVKIGNIPMVFKLIFLLSVAKAGAIE